MYFKLIITAALIILNFTTKAQLQLSISNPEIDKNLVNVICNYTTYKKLVKFNDSNAVQIDTANLLSITVSHIGYATKEVSKKEFSKEKYNITLQKKLVQTEAVSVTARTLKTVKNFKKNKKETAFLLPIGETKNGTACFDVQIPADVHQIKYLEFTADGLLKGDTVIITVYNTEVDLLKNNISQEKVIIIPKDNSNIILQDIHKYEVAFPNENFYCSFLVKNTLNTSRNTFVLTRVKKEVSSNYIMNKETKKLTKTMPNHNYIDEYKEPNDYPHIEYKIIYYK